MEIRKLNAAPDLVRVVKAPTRELGLMRSAWARTRRTFMVLAVCVMAICVLYPDASVASSQPAPAAEQTDSGIRLVEAARKQTWIPAIYSPDYRKIAYPNGDVPWYLGVCTDVVVRAYRGLGIDLQVLVHEARAGTGDTNIDHRRVPVLKRFFERRARQLPVTKNPADFAAGDIVTYYLPNGRFSKNHIAIVSDRKNSNGIPFIIHNRGWGVSEEDWLFEEKITGHFRFHPKPQTSLHNVSNTR